MTRKPSLIVSGANAPYFTWLRDLWISWDACGAGALTDFGVMDLGLEAGQRGWLEERNVIVTTPDWPYDGLAGTSPEWFKAMVCRPFLPEIFPGWEYVFWLDADSWFQTADALPLFVAGAAQDGFCVVPAVDRAYKPTYHGGHFFLDWQKSCLEKGFGAEMAERIYRHPIISAGAICGAPDAPHWKIWQDYAEIAIRRAVYREAEQSALNVTVHLGTLKTHFLPSWCHWVCNMGLPLIDMDSGLYVEPHQPHMPVSIMGMPGNTRTDKFSVPTSRGDTIATTLRYGTAARAAKRHRIWKKSTGEP